MFKMYKRGVQVAVLAGIAIGAWVVSLSLGLFGPGGGAGGKDGPEKTAPAPAENVQQSQVSDGVLRVRVEGKRLMVAGKEMSVEEICKLAEEHKARVTVERAPDARIGPLDRLEAELRRRDIHYDAPRS